MKIEEKRKSLRRKIKKKTDVFKETIKNITKKWFWRNRILKKTQVDIKYKAKEKFLKWKMEVKLSNEKN